MIWVAVGAGAVVWTAIAVAVGVCIGKTIKQAEKPLAPVYTINVTGSAKPEHFTDVTWIGRA